ncbi:hypothetical protein B0A48_18195 [Cryoendolithus antarcticus]|uniref:HhH-GPD domain-containing protein n=1 Tax=Cryoendolithus antarcticus TaxID=1507870 RepID=A0A1V8S9Y6_9PEZI|nr:hypothetical protein B0A48_18195 [Cryoendolithus antarcticus]
MARATRSSASKADLPDSNGLSSPPATPATNGKAKGKGKAAKVKAEPAETPANPGRKRGTKRVKTEDDDDVNNLPHNLGTALPTPGVEDAEETVERPKKRTRKSAKSEPESPDVKTKLENDESIPVADVKPAKASPKKKAKYGVTPGESPYPDYARPTPEECKEVVRLLSKVHGAVQAPKEIPMPSLDVAGCGEVPSVIDALIRTRLSAATTNANSSNAFKGLVKKFGTLKDGVGKGSVDWNAVRLAPYNDVFEAIKCGGLANNKARDIQLMLQQTWEENQERSALLLSQSDDPAGAEKEASAEKNMEIWKAKQNILSLDHLHLLSTPDAIARMQQFNGIGPKTASCVALFCLQRPSFAVDTHVFRLCQYLGWVPKTPKKGEPRVGRETTYAHCDARIPDEYKYALHQLMIKHGKVCPRCRAATGSGSANWKKGCPIEHLVKRHGEKKGGVSVKARKESKAAAEGEEGSMEEGEEDSEVEGEEWSGGEGEDDGAASELSDVEDEE